MPLADITERVNAMIVVDSEGFVNSALHKRVTEWVQEHNDDTIVLGHWKGQPVMMEVNTVGGIFPTHPIEAFYPKFSGEKWLYQIGVSSCASIMVGDSGRLYVDFCIGDCLDEVPTLIGTFDSVLNGKPLSLDWRELCP